MMIQPVRSRVHRSVCPLKKFKNQGYPCLSQSLVIQSSLSIDDSADDIKRQAALSIVIQWPGWVRKQISQMFLSARICSWVDADEQRLERTGDKQVPTKLLKLL